MYDLSLWLDSRDGIGAGYDGVDRESFLLGMPYMDDLDGSFRNVYGAGAVFGSGRAWGFCMPEAGFEVIDPLARSHAGGVNPKLDVVCRARACGQALLLSGLASDGSNATGESCLVETFGDVKGPGPCG